MGIFKQWFQKNTASEKPLSRVPKHIAIVMDGNGRWAESRGLPRTAGHKVGVERVRDAVKTCVDFGVPYLTLYAFSTENWRRPETEVGFLMKLFIDAFQAEIDELHHQDIRVHFIGLKENLSPELLAVMKRSEEMTATNTRLTLNIALNYGGRSEIIHAVREIAQRVHSGELVPENIVEQTLSDSLFTAGQPDPDLLIRPGGEKRVSNFLIWQAAYAELYFSNVYWPDFGRNEMIEALHYFEGRERRFGRVKGVKAT